MLTHRSVSGVFDTTVEQGRLAHHRGDVPGPDVVEVGTLHRWFAGFYEAGLRNALRRCWYAHDACRCCNQRGTMRQADRYDEIVFDRPSWPRLVSISRFGIWVISSVMAGRLSNLTKKIFTWIWRNFLHYNVYEHF